MKNESGRGGTYVDRARDQMQTYVRGILSDNESLRVSLAAVEAEAMGLRREICSLNEQLTLSRMMHEQLSGKLQEIRGESEQRFAEYAKLESVNANLANLYVASYQLHSTLQRESVLAAIQEIVVNLVGSEDFAVFEREDRQRFRLATSVGIEQTESIAGHERVVEATTSGQTWVSSRDGDLTACIPLRVDGEVTGFIVIRRLLAHKSGLEPVDLELFDLLATHAAMALYASSLQEARPATEASWS